MTRNFAIRFAIHICILLQSYKSSSMTLKVKQFWYLIHPNLLSSFHLETKATAMLDTPTAYPKLVQHGPAQSNPSLAQITGLNWVQPDLVGMLPCAAKSRRRAEGPGDMSGTGWRANQIRLGVQNWCGWRGSNPRPLASEGPTLH